LTQPWTFSGEPPGAAGTAEPVILVEGSTFCISGIAGDIHPGRAHGLFVRDTRVLSRWELAIDGVTPQPLAVQHGDPYTATFIGRMPPPAGLADSTLLVVRRRYIGNGMREDLTVRNIGTTQVRCAVTLAADADFADLFEVKDGRAQPPSDVTVEVAGDTLTITGRRGQHEQSMLVRAGPDPGLHLGAGVLRWEMTLPARGQWTSSIEAVPGVDGALMLLRHPRGSPVEHAEPARRLREWRRRGPEIHTADPGLAAVLRRSVEDLGALRIFDPQNPQRAVVAAGVPWFMALFGRDSLLTSWMVLPIDTSLAIGTLQTLADHQGHTVDSASEEEPGRILHEIRFGPATGFALGGRSVYYGTADATPLFVMLLGELRRWGGDTATIGALLPHADRALDWIEHYGDTDGDGFVEYQRKTGNGLANQGWKDSWDGINFADGRIAQAPIALAEVQAYCYAAYRARAHLAAHTGDSTAQRQWTGKAAQLKDRFNETFWLPGRGWFAVGLDKDKTPIDALTSNIGHCLWAGIVDDDKAAAVADHLLSPDMFTGWGIRTLASSMARYNPVSYHNGSVWPHDNALCASGLMRYGFTEHAQKIVTGLLEAADRFGHRLPELFCGFTRTELPEPVPYPAACSPQAWAAATPFSFLRSLLRFDPELPARQVRCAPEVPDRYLPLRVSGLRVSGLDIGIDVRRQAWHLTGLAGTGIELVRQHHAEPGNSGDRGPGRA
jgi:glycogen debranching enzyme